WQRRSAPHYGLGKELIHSKNTIMDSATLKALQAPIKEKYTEDPGSALITLKAEGRVGEGISCKVDTGKALVEAGLHPATGGDGLLACSGDMLLEALVACAGVTLQAVATAIGITLEEGSIRAEGDLDFRGTLGVSKEAPVGFRAIRLQFNLRSNASEEELASLAKLTERYCVVYQTLVKGVPVESRFLTHT
ncbi:MAG TPA: OsmC family protein, partial [Ferruginibacter sp.]|nr:OsmC family protein [Ferruginibacter sp.]